MSRLLKLCVFAIGLAAGIEVERARADEGYVCEGGRIVYVRFGEVETMKKSDPCIAAYYGLTVEPAAVSAQAPAASPAPTATPVRTLTPAPANRPSVDLRRLEDADVARSRTGEDGKAPRPVRAADGTNYRNIPVINAAAGPSVFVHTK